ncbi:hypothetical protein ML401_35235 (plasmid) [Bradyrhizobium sp. 62B]|uniref:hypothetical protein n=1 Tax=Bradyrhizobium sp. 62B TaxID=2898442 RepID=UPI002557CF2D|nr:hypothetical protein ML401_35235 [Bradyrhizobium sp. 62B]
MPHSHPSPIRTADDTIDLLRRLAAHYPDTKITGILNRQGRTTATGLSFTANRVSSLRTHWEIPCFEPKQQVQDGECMKIEKAARALGIAPSTLHRCLNDSFIAGEQITPDAPWRIRINDKLRSRFVESAPERLREDVQGHESTRRLAANHLATCKVKWRPRFWDQRLSWKKAAPSDRRSEQ